MAEVTVPQTKHDEDRLRIGPLDLGSRLLIGTSRYPSPRVMLDAGEASGSERATVSIRRVNLKDTEGESVLGRLRERGIQILPNTAGCYTAREAVLTAGVAREA